MRLSTPVLLFFLVGCFAVDLEAAQARVMKVLPHYLDERGRHTLSPSLYERDAYQAHLRRRPELRSTLRFDVHWKAKAAGRRDLSVRIDMRGVKGNELTSHTLGQAVAKKGWLGTWSSIPLPAEMYEALGELNAWRVTLWEGETLLAEQRSFLWE